MASKKEAERTESLPGKDGKTFKVGDGACTGFNGDAYPFTVRKVSKSGRKVWVSKDKYTVIRPGMLAPAPAPELRDTFQGIDGIYPVHFTPVDVPEEQWEEYTLRKDGHFHTKGNSKGSAWSLGHGRRYSYNFSF